MTFSELEGLLLLAVGVLLWRLEVVRRQRDEESERANRYARHMKDVYHKRGVIKLDPERGYYYEETDRERT